MKVLLLGATGLLGHNVLQRLLAEGHEATALVRRSDGLRLPGGGWHTVVGSVLDYPTLCRAAKGCEAVVNCAGATDMSLPGREDFMPMNHDLCKMLVRLMEETGIRVLVHTSTVNTIGYGTAGHPANEEAPMRPPFEGSFYADSKRAGELVVLGAAQHHKDWHVVVINPGFMIGAYDTKPSSGRMLLAGYRRRAMVAPKGGKAFVAVQDVAQAAVAALTRGDNGARYIAVNSQGCFGIKELYKMQASTMGYRQHVLTLPNWLLAVAGRLGDALRAVGVRTELSTLNVRQLMVHEYYDNSRGREALGYAETPIEQAIGEFHKWRETLKKQ
ncbi:MAG: NAD-dependent epimerase/dehydratase family protein [Bacteroidales bacterium]|nr:NAD-dependent epimerase/dehydratase family protein [Bacteroidales bacterium]